VRNKFEHAGFVVPSKMVKQPRNSYYWELMWNNNNFNSGNTRTRINTKKLKQRQVGFVHAHFPSR